MRSFMFVTLILVLMMGIVMAGGIVTNTNQSAAYMRTLNRNASTDIDAVYFNPAGLTKLEDGLHLSLSNQSIWQTKTVNNDYANLANNEFVGDVAAPIFPNLYLAYKTGNLVISAGFEPIGGGGSANYDEGLPSFEKDISDLVPAFLTSGVEKYALSASFEGSSIYYGGQLGLSYKINDLISVGVGARYAMAANTYLGSIMDIGLYNIALGTWSSPKPYMDGAAATMTGTAATLQPIIDAQAGGFTLAELQGAGYLTAAQVQQLTGGLTLIGVADPSVLTAAEVQGAFSQAAQVYTAKGVLLDKGIEVDAKQGGSGISPVLSLYLTPSENLGIALRYEMITKLEIENDTEVDDSGLFTDGAKTNADMPAMFAMGVSFKPMEKLRAELDLNYYFNTGVDWDGREDNVDNGYEVGLAVEYCLNEKMTASVGFSNGNGGATDEYQTDLSYSLKSNTIGLGVAYKVSDNMTVNVGGLNTFYQDGERVATTYTEKYAKTTYGFAFGIDYKF